MRKTKNILSCAVLGAVIMGIFPVSLWADSLMKDYPAQVSSAVEQQVYAFRLSDVKLLDSPFTQAMELDAQYLARLEPDRFLHCFRKYAGLEPKAPQYGGWETATISGHSLGHYLTAIALLYAAGGDEEFKQRVDYIVDELAECQQAWGNGFVGGFPRSQEVFTEIKNGTIRSQGFDLNGLWVPWYTQHKLFMGLVDAYLYCGNEKARQILIGLTDWSWDCVGRLTDEQFQRMLDCEHGGMNEAFAEVYAITGDQKALALAERFYHHRILDPLAAREDKLNGIHGNTQIPKLIGLARLYQLTGKEQYHTASSFFWDTVVQNRTYVNGGNTDSEHFFPPEEFSRHLTPYTAETCNTYNMLKLSRKLFAMNPDASTMDYYERALYNHILASQDPKEGMMIYFCPLKSGHFKTYNSPFDSFWCCTGTGMENHVKYGESIYFYNDNALYVNLFIPSVLNWKEKGVKLTQQTGYPADGKIQLTLECQSPVNLSLKIRQPHWLTDPVQYQINGGHTLTAQTAGDFLAFERTWKNGDVLTFELPMKLRIETMPDDPRKVAFFCGPVLLAAGMGTEGIEEVKYTAGDRGKYDQFPTPPMPVIVSPAKDLTSLLTPAPQPGSFTLTGDVLKISGQKSPHRDITLIPFYQMHYQRFMVYFDVFDPAAWNKQQADYEAEQARLRQIEARTADVFIPGKMQPERDHSFTGEKTETGEHQGRSWRHAVDGGWFAFEMKVLPDAPMELRLTYWGSDGPGRDFDIFVGDTKIATERLNREHPGQFFDRYYPIPQELTQDREKITVRLAAHPSNIAGGLYEARTMKQP